MSNRSEPRRDGAHRNGTIQDRVELKHGLHAAHGFGPRIFLVYFLLQNTGAESDVFVNGNVERIHVTLGVGRVVVDLRWCEENGSVGGMWAKLFNKGRVASTVARLRVASSVMNIQSATCKDSSPSFDDAIFVQDRPAVVGLPRGFSATESGLPRRTGTIPERFSEVAKNVRVSDPLNGLLYFRKFEKKKKGGGY